MKRRSAILACVLALCLIFSTAAAPRRTFAEGATETFSVIIPDHPSIPFNVNSPLFDDIEALIGVRPTVQVINSDAYADKLSITIGGGNMPDAIYIEDKSQMLTYAAMGALYPISSDWEKAPNYKALIDQKYSNEFAYMGAADGGLYYFTTIVDRFLVPYLNAFVIREDIYSANNVSLPTTWDEVYDGLVALKAAYPDVYPLLLDATQSLTEYWCYAWGTGPALYLNETTGKWTCGATDANFKSMVQWFAKAYADGLLDPEFVKMEYTTFTRKAFGLDDRSSFFFMENNWSAAGANKQAVDAGIEGVNCQLLAPPKLSNGEGGRLWPHSSVWEYGFAVTSSAKNVDAALKYFDFLYSPEGMEWSNYGPAELGICQVIDGGVLNGGGYALDAKWAGVVYEQTPNYLYSYKRPLFCLINWQDDNNITDYPDVYATTSAWMEAQLPYKYYAVPLLTDEEQLVYVEANTNIKDIMNEYVEKFILGTLDIESSWDTFMNRLENAKLSDVLALLDAATERMAK